MTTTDKARPRKVRVTVEVDAAGWAALAKLDPKDVPADVADYIGELVATARNSSYRHLVLDVKKG
jgi:ABC-type amino acid transport substrate-binding protein